MRHISMFVVWVEVKGKVINMGRNSDLQRLHFRLQHRVLLLPLLSLPANYSCLRTFSFLLFICWKNVAALCVSFSIHADTVAGSPAPSCSENANSFG